MRATRVRTKPAEVVEPAGGKDSVPLTAADLVRFITLRHAPHRGDRSAKWACFPELRVGTGYARNARTADVESRIDFLAMPLWPGSGDGVTAYEIKVSRSDFLHELKQPLKRRPALRYSNLLYFCATEGLIKSPEVPVECGLIEVSPTGVMKVVVPAPWRETFMPTNTFLMSICRRVASQEQEMSQK